MDWTKRKTTSQGKTQVCIHCFSWSVGLFNLRSNAISKHIILSKLMASLSYFAVFCFPTIQAKLPGYGILMAKTLMTFSMPADDSHLLSPMSVPQARKTTHSTFCFCSHTKFHSYINSRKFLASDPLISLNYCTPQITPDSSDKWSTDLHLPNYLGAGLWIFLLKLQHRSSAVSTRCPSVWQK